MDSPLAPTSAVIALQVAQDELTAGNIAAASGTLLEILRHAPGNAAAHNLLGFVALRERSYEKAESCFREALAIEPQNRVYQEKPRSRELDGALTRSGERFARGARERSVARVSRADFQLTLRG